MFDLKKISEKLNESFVMANVTAYDFVGELSESTFVEFNTVLAESAGTTEFENEFIFDRLSESIETGDMNAYNEILEGVLGDIGGRLKAVWERIVSICKAMVARFKGSLAAFTKNTDAWVSVVGPKVKENASKASDFKYDGHKWDFTKMEELNTKKMGNVETQTVFATSFEAAKELVNVARDAEAHKGDESKYEYADKSKDYEIEYSKAVEDYNKKLVGRVNFSEGLNDLKKNIKGEKEVVEGFSVAGPTEMIAKIEGHKGLLKEISANYEENGKEAEKVLDVLAQVKPLKGGNGDNTKARLARINKRLEISNKLSQYVLGRANDMRGAAYGLNKEMVGEFMAVLNRFAGFKGKKEDKK